MKLPPHIKRRQLDPPILPYIVQFATLENGLFGVLAACREEVFVGADAGEGVVLAGLEHGCFGN
jgi:hypothetical protein